jgi:membrane dipeptidase
MKVKIVIISILISQQIIAQSYQKIHTDAIVVDTHNDIISTMLYKGISIEQNLNGITHSDLARLKEGGLDVQLFSVWCDGTQKDPFSFALREMDTLDAIVRRNPAKIAEVGNSKELLAAVKQTKIAAMFGV